MSIPVPISHSMWDRGGGSGSDSGRGPDTWMLGIAVGLILMGVLNGSMSISVIRRVISSTIVPTGRSRLNVSHGRLNASGLGSFSRPSMESSSPWGPCSM